MLVRDHRFGVDASILHAAAPIPATQGIEGQNDSIAPTSVDEVHDAPVDDDCHLSGKAFCAEGNRCVVREDTPTSS
jgi:hypothetical protein